MFLKPNKITINKNKTMIFIDIRPFDYRLYLSLIFRSFDLDYKCKMDCSIRFQGPGGTMSYLVGLPNN